MTYKNGIRYTLIAMALTALSVPSYALTFQKGPYGGILLGANMASATWNGINSDVAVNNNDSPKSIMEQWSPTGSTSQSNFAGHPYVGYQWIGPKIYLATEIGGTFSNDILFSQNSNRSFTNLMYSPDFVNTTADTNAVATLTGAEFDMDFKPGFTVKERGLIYARGGLAFNTVKIYDGGSWTEIGQNFNEYPPLPVPANGYNSATKHVIGIRIGVGTEYLISEHFGVVLDYTYTRYGNIQTFTAGANPGSGNFLDPNQNFYQQLYGTDTPVVSLSTQAVMLGISYHS